MLQVHRLREVLALVGFTRFEAVMPDIHGEYETDVELAQIAQEPSWFPAVENRGEGVFLQLCADAVRTWLSKQSVTKRLNDLAEGHGKWVQQRDSQRQFPGGRRSLNRRSSGGETQDVFSKGRSHLCSFRCQFTF